MSGFIHIAQKKAPWQIALRASAGMLMVAGILWYWASDEGLPMSSPSQAPARPFVKAEPLPAPAPMLLAQDTQATENSDVSPERSKTADAPDDGNDYASRNAGIDIQRLTATRPMAARTFLNEVLLAPGSQAGFVVAEVLPESRFERMGLKPGDVIYSLDTSKMAGVNENSMIALMQQTELELEVYRNGTLTRLHTNLAAVENGDAVVR